MKRELGLVISIIVALVANIGAETILTHTGADDIFIRESQPTTAQGDTRNLIGGQRTAAQFVTLMKFSLADVYADLGATGGTITDVQLDLGPAMTSGAGVADDFICNLYQYTVFDADTATWNDPDGTAGTDATAGGTLGTLLGTETLDARDWPNDVRQGFSSTTALVNYLQAAYDAGDAEVFFRLSNDGASENVNSFMLTDAGDVQGTGQASLVINRVTIPFSITLNGLDQDSNLQIRITGRESTSYFIYQSSDLTLRPYRWPLGFTGVFPASNQVDLVETNMSASQQYYLLSDRPVGVRIMCVGDSITEGGVTFHIYRPLLNQLLAAAGYRYEFVGSRSSMHDGIILKHEGYGGKNAEQIASYISTTFSNHVADVVLIHAGHNYDGSVLGETVVINKVDAATRSMIATARVHNPRATILLAQVITSAKLPKYAYIPALNDRLASIAGELNTESQPVLIVNQADGWNPGDFPDSDTISDLVHPSLQGANKMANKWFNALVPLFSE